MSASDIELSVVIPCLNESETIGICVEKALHAISGCGVAGEVIVADNGSTDGSPDIARKLGAQVVHVERKGYGAALMGGIAKAEGRYVIMGDADNSYDFLEIPKFLDMLRQGHDLVMGCRLPSGNGAIAPEAMPFLHRYIGNPLFSMLAKYVFRCPINDVYCGLRGFSARHYASLNMVCTGMEFAIEMIIRSCLFGANMAEVPITLHKDGRKASKSHLRTFVDGWKTLRLYMLYAPKWIFLLPGFTFMGAGFLGCALVLCGIPFFGRVPDTMTLLFSCLFISLGYQSVVFALMTMSYAVTYGILPAHRNVERFYRFATLERGVLLGAGSLGVGALLLLVSIATWLTGSFTLMEYRSTVRILAPGIILTAMGLQTILATFFISMLNLRRDCRLIVEEEVQEKS